MENAEFTDRRSIDEMQEEVLHKAFGNEIRVTPRRLLVQIEGPDGVGKSTQAKLLSKALNIPIIKATDKDDPVIKATYERALACEGVERYLLFAWMRCNSLRDAKLLDMSIMDRGPISPIVYQGFMGGVDLKAILRIEREIFKDFRFKNIIMLADKPYIRDNSNDSYDDYVWKNWPQFKQAYIKAGLMWDNNPIFIFCDNKTQEEVHKEIMENFVG